MSRLQGEPARTSARSRLPGSLAHAVAATAQRTAVFLPPWKRMSHSVEVPAVSAVSVDPEEQSAVIHLLIALLRGWRLLVVLPLLFGFLAAVVSLMQARKYSAEASFVPNTPSSESQIGALAQQFGMALSTAAPGQTPEFYKSLLVSRDILRDVVRGLYTVRTEDGGTRRQNLVQFWKIEDGSGPGGSASDVAIERLRNSLSTSVDPLTGVVSLRFTSVNPSVSEQVVGRLVQLTQDFDLTKRRTQAAARRRFAERQMHAAKADLDAAQARLEEFVAGNRLFQLSGVLMVQQNKLSQQLMLRQQIYASILQSYEQARLDEVRDTPVITLVENPSGSARVEPRGTALRAVLGVLLGLMLGVVIAVLRDVGRRASARRSPELREFREVRAQVLGQFRFWRGRNGQGSPLPLGAGSGRD
jgi:uncharacterized protein involved in exopolysaccharide biosynthesis